MTENNEISEESKLLAKEIDNVNEHVQQIEAAHIELRNEVEEIKNLLERVVSLLQHHIHDHTSGKAVIPIEK